MPITSYPAIPYLQQDLISSGVYTPRTYVKLFGKSNLVGTSSGYYDLWLGNTQNYTPPKTAITMQLQSTSASDNATGSGAQVISVVYLDSSYNQGITNVTLAGTTSVSLPISCLRINAMYTSQVGSTGYPVGTITLTNLASTVQYGYIEPLRNTAQQVIYTVPAGKTLYISQWYAATGSLSGASAKNSITQFVLRATNWLDMGYTRSITVTNGGLNPTEGFLTTDICSITTGGTPIILTDPIRIPAQSDVKISAADAGGNVVSAMGSFVGWIE